MGDNIFVLNDFGLTERSRVNKSGAVKKRFTVTIKGEPLVHNLDPKALGKGPAEAIAKFFRDSIGGIAAVAKPATLRARAAAQRAFHSGTKVVKGKTSNAGADRRYVGGKLGPMEPNQTNRLFNDSGRLVKSIVSTANEQGYTINVSSNRFDPELLDNGGTAALQRIFLLLRQYVPQFGDAESLKDALPIQRAIRDSMALMIQKVRAGQTAQMLERIKTAMELGSEIQETTAAFAGEG